MKTTGDCNELRSQTATDN